MNPVTKKPGLFYGWWIVAACFSMAVYTSGVVGWGFTAVFEPIKNEFGWSSAEVAFSSSLRGMETGLFAPAVGLLVNRFGPKTVIFAGGVFTGLGLILMGRVDSLFTFYTASALIALGLSLCSANALQVAVAAWFHRRMSLALGLMSCGFGFSGFIIPLAVLIVDKVGWRMGQIYFGIGMFAIILPLSLLIRRRPEDYGLLPDGDTAPSDAPSDNISEHPVNKAADGDRGISMMQVLSSRTFWFIAVAMSAQHLVAGGVSTHVMPYLSSIGYSREVAGFVASGIPIASVLGRFSFGWLGDRLSNKKLAIFGFAILAIGMLSFAYAVSGIFIIALFLLFFGIGFGGTNTMRAVLPRAYFGMKSYGTVLGLVMGVGTVGSMVGAPLAGYIYDTTGTYQLAWYIYTGIAALSLLSILLIPSAVNPESKTTAAKPVPETAGGAKR
jgi:MFS family permease